MELTLEKALKKGIEAYKAEQIQKADKFHTAILQSQPKHPDANNSMGVLAVDIGKPEQALPFFITAIATNSYTTQFWPSYIEALIVLEKFATAKGVLKQPEEKIKNHEVFNTLRDTLEG